MKDQMTLLDVPKDSPSHEERLEAFKKRIGIWTHSGPGESSREFPKWTALLLPTDGEGKERYSDHRPYCKSDDPFELIAGYCRILQESERMEYGHTEREAIQNLCQANKIPFEV